MVRVVRSIVRRLLQGTVTHSCSRQLRWTEHSGVKCKCSPMFCTQGLYWFGDAFVYLWLFYLVSRDEFQRGAARQQRSSECKRLISTVRRRQSIRDRKDEEAQVCFSVNPKVFSLESAGVKVDGTERFEV